MGKPAHRAGSGKRGRPLRAVRTDERAPDPRARRRPHHRALLLADDKDARDYLARQRWPPLELQMLESHALDGEGLLRASGRWRALREAGEDLELASKLARRLLPLLKKPAISAWDMSEPSVRVPDPIEEMLRHRIKTWDILSKDLPAFAGPGVNRGGLFRVFCVDLFHRIDEFRRAGVAGTPSRWPRPREVLALFLLKGHQLGGLTDSAATRTVQRARCFVAARRTLGANLSREVS